LLVSKAARYGLVIGQVQQQPEQRLMVGVEGAPQEVIAWLEQVPDAGVVGPRCPFPMLRRAGPAASCWP
jgi:hypothetical protein